MLKASQKKSNYILLSSLLFWGPLIFFVWIANQVTGKEPLPGDLSILRFVRDNFPQSLTGLFQVITNAGGLVGIILITGVITGILVYRKKLTEAAMVLAGVAGAGAANVVMKLLFKRERPSLWESIIHEQSFSFPSGHAMASSALVFALIFIAWKTRYRWVVLIVGIVFMIGVGLSRVYFGVHYPSDILAGWFASLFWVGVVAAILARPELKEFFSDMTRRLHPIKKR